MSVSKIKSIDEIPPESVVIIRVDDVEQFLSETPSLSQILSDINSIAVVLNTKAQLDLVSDEELAKLGLRRISH